MHEPPERQVGPAAPRAHGRRPEPLATYRRRGSRLTAAQAGAWDRRAAAWLLPEEVAERRFDPSEWFGRVAPLLVEIGSGIGETAVAVAAERPEADVLAFEVWRPGVAETLRRIERAGVDNVRVCSLDAVWSLRHLVGPGSIAELWTFFPDPWPKQRHRKRRLVTPEFAALAASCLAGRGVWRLATDWADYAAQMRAALDAEPALAGGPVPRWPHRPTTRFERRAAREGRGVADLAYRRVGTEPQ